MSNSLKIATWNLEQPKPNSWSKNPIILKQIQAINADIWILTETNDVINLGKEYFKAASYSQPEWHGFNYTTIWSRFPFKRSQTYDPTLAVCVEIESPVRFLLYGTIITWAHDGVSDGEAKVWERHYQSIELHGKDWAKLNQGLPFCVAGDFNEALSQPFRCGTPKGREMLNNALEQNNLICVTANDKIGYNIDHICLSVEWAEE